MNNILNINKVKTVVLCKGLQASGKTTWAIEQLRKHPGKYKRVNRDELRIMLDNDLYDPSNEEFITELQNSIIERSLMKNYDVILDCTNFREENWIDTCEIAQRVGGVRVVEKYFDITLKESLARNAKRPKPVPESAIIRTYETHIKNKHLEMRDEFFSKKTIPEYLEQDPTKIDAIIVDIDGTLAINVERDYYDMTKIASDVPNKPICDLVNFLSKKHAVLIVSGRTVDCRNDTVLWFSYYGVSYTELFMRKTGDNRSDTIVKEEILKEILKKYNILYVLDDRKGVVSMWRKNKLCCLQVAHGDF